MKYKAEQLWNKIWTAQDTPCSLYSGKQRVSMCLVAVKDLFEWSLSGWFSFCTCFLYKNIYVYKAFLTVVGRLVHIHIFFIVQVNKTIFADGPMLAAGCDHTHDRWEFVSDTQCMVVCGWPKPARVIGKPVWWKVIEQIPCRQHQEW